MSREPWNGNERQTQSVPMLEITRKPVRLTLNQRSEVIIEYDRFACARTFVN